MRKLPIPTDDAAIVYTTCISKVRNTRLRGRLRRVIPRVVAAAQEFANAGASSTFHTIGPTVGVGPNVTTDEMIAVYDQRMARKRSVGRPIYDRLLSAAPNWICPLCSQRTVSTLDHYLPKASYPALAVVPLNLFPACIDCNKLKLEMAPTVAQEQTLHPYFDNVEGSRWLLGEVVEESPASVRFFVDAPAQWDALMSARVNLHFRTFGLAALYRSHAAVELVNIRQSMVTLYGKAGANAVREHLEEQAKSREAAHLNQWQTAMYRALAESNWYCDGGFNA